MSKASERAFTAAINEIRETPKGRESVMYGHLRDLFIKVLGYKV